MPPMRCTCHYGRDRPSLCLRILQGEVLSSGQDVFRYMLPGNTPQSKNLIYFPYWRFKGMWFACDGNGVQHKFIDVSHQAVASPLFPASLGLRSQALRLKFVTPETAGRFLQPTQSFAQAAQNFEDRLGKTSARPALHHAHIGETISLIYAPFYIENRIYDAVLNLPIAAALTEDFDIDQLPAESPNWRIHFISTLCPSCGWIWREKEIRWFCCAKIVFLPGIRSAKS